MIDKLDRLRHLQPGLTAGHGCGNVGGAHAGGEGAQRAVSAGVRVGADDQVTRQHQSLLRQQRVLNAHRAHIVVVRQLLGTGEIAHHFALFGRLDVLVGYKVVGDQHHPASVKDFSYPDALELTDGNGRSDIVGQHQVHRDTDQLAGEHLFQAGVGGQDFFSQGHSHLHPP